MREQAIISPEQSEIGVDCGLVAIYDEVDTRVHDALLGMLALQGRGQAAAGLAVFGENGPYIEKGLGLLSQAISPEMDLRLKQESESPVVVGHLRYSTTGNGDGTSRVQPFDKHGFAIGQNGHEEYMRTIAESFGVSVDPGTGDTQILNETIAHVRDQRDCDVIEALHVVMPKIEGAASLVLGEEDRIIGVRDLHGYRPLVIGETLDGGMMFASETVALDLVKAEFVREVEPGEIVWYDGKELHSEFITGEVNESFCAFEFIYFAHPNSMIGGKNVYQIREELGHRLGAKNKVESDIVVGVQFSGAPYARGYSRATKIPEEPGALTKNNYAGRTFIDDIGTISEKVRRKHWPNETLVRGKDITVVDDSIVRGNTMKEVITMLRAAGAKSVHVRIPSAPYKRPCFFGMNTQDASKLIAFRNNIEETRRELGADTLDYLDEEEVMDVIENFNPEDSRETVSAASKAGKFCTACMTGEYRSPVPVELIVNPRLRGIE